MDNIVNNPGLQHLVEHIFWNLNHKSLEACGMINQSCQKILNNPLFWLKEFIRRGLSKKNKMDWMKAIQMTKDIYMEKYVVLYLKRSTMNKRVVDPPCFFDEDFVKNAPMKMTKYLTDNTYDNTNIFGWTSLHSAASEGDLETVKILALLAENSNALCKRGVQQSADFKSLI